MHETGGPMKTFVIDAIANTISPTLIDDADPGDTIQWTINSGSGVVEFEKLPDPLFFDKHDLQPASPALATVLRPTDAEGEFFEVAYVPAVTIIVDSKGRRRISPTVPMRLRARIIIR